LLLGTVFIAGYVGEIFQLYWQWQFFCCVRQCN